MTIVVLGAGLMAKAIIHDLLTNKTTDNILVVDQNKSQLTQFHHFFTHQTTLQIKQADLTKKDIVTDLMRQADLAISAVPYMFNEQLTKTAIKQQTHFLDLGGNNTVVTAQKKLHTQAQKKQVLIIPDNGLAPGLVSIIARDCVDYFDTTKRLQMRVGGVPVNPTPPLNYQLVFSVNGLINEYIEPTLVLDHGKIIEKPSLTEIETITFPPPFGNMEAFLTSGGCSTLPYTYQQQVGYLDYKTIRYPGHCTIMKTLVDVGLTSSEPIIFNQQTVTPRQFLQRYLSQTLPTTGDDVVLVKISGEGIKNNRHCTHHYQIIDYNDRHHGLSAMMRMTGFPVAITASMILNNIIEGNGVYTPEEIVPPTLMFSELNKRDIQIDIATHNV